MKSLQILFIDDDERKAKDLRKRLEEDKDLNKIEVKYAICDSKGFSPNNDTISTLSTIADMLIIGDRAYGEDGFKIAERIRDKDSYIPIILRTDLKETHPELADIMSYRDSREHHIIDGIIDKYDHVEKIQKIIKAKLRKPLRVAILGLGALGVGFIQNFKSLDEIKCIKGFSERDKEGEPVVDYKRIYDLLETNGGDEIHLVNSLEEAIDGTDCAIICTSAMPRSSLEKIAKTDHRLDLLEKEAPKIYNYSRRMFGANYNGLVVNLTNPVGGNLRVANQAGLEESQLTSPFNLDEERYLDLVKSTLKDEYEEFLEEAVIVGEHGSPDFVFKNRKFIKKLSSKEFRIYEDRVKRIKEALNELLIESREIGAKTMKAASELRFGYLEASRAATEFFKDLSHFTEKPEESAYCYYKFGGYGGYVALPVKIEYFPNIRVYPDEERIREIDEEGTKKIKDILKLQNIYVMNFLRSLKKKLVGEVYGYGSRKN